MQGVPHKARILHRHRIIQPHPFDHRVTVLNGGFLAKDILHRVADKSENGKGNQRDQKQHENRLHDPSCKNDDHGRPRADGSPVTPQLEI